MKKTIKIVFCVLIIIAALVRGNRQVKAEFIADIDGGERRFSNCGGSERTWADVGGKNSGAREKNGDPVELIRKNCIRLGDQYGQPGYPETYGPEYDSNSRGAPENAYSIFRYKGNEYSSATKEEKEEIEEVRNKIAEISIRAADNNHIGYCQEERLLYYNQLASAEVNWDPSAITVDCAADCSSSTAANVIATGYQLNIELLKQVNPRMTTYDEAGILTAAGFTEYTYGSIGLVAGDILLAKEHTNIYVGTGLDHYYVDGGDSVAIDEVYYTNTDAEAELDEQVFDFQGNPQIMTYDESKTLGYWIFTFIKQFLDFIISLMINIIIDPIIGWLNILQNFIMNTINIFSGINMTTNNVTS